VAKASSQMLQVLVCGPLLGPLVQMMGDSVEKCRCVHLCSCVCVCACKNVYVCVLLELMLLYNIMNTAPN
jgi:hypothetical protein